MWHSIQENLKLINSRLSFWDCVSLGLTALCLLAFTVFLYLKVERARKPVLYIQKGTQTTQTALVDSRPFGSRNGTTYTFSWCSNSGQIKQENKIYYQNEAQAQSVGRTLSKLCQK